MAPMRILVSGATGYLGGLLVQLLVADGHDVRAGGRDPSRLRTLLAANVLAQGAGGIRGTVETFELDLLRPETVRLAMEDVDVAYYLVHSMAEGEVGFVERDMQAATTFGDAAAQAGVGRIIYLGGLGDEADDLSPHLRSRHLVGKLLARAAVPVLEFRAAVVIGAGSASFRMLRQLTDRLPVMITPRWVRVRCQPIAVRDVLAYLSFALDRPEIGGIVEIGGPDILSYGSMMRRYAALRGQTRLMLPVPVLTPRLSSYWVGLVTDVAPSIARPLIEGLRNEVVVRDPEPARAFGIRTLDYESAVRRALGRS